MKQIIYTLALTALIMSLGSHAAHGQAKIKAYFNHPVDTTYSTGVNAVYLPNGTISDTICAYILRAKYTVDLMQYQYLQDSTYGPNASIAAACDSAYAHGVRIRYIYDSSIDNSGLDGLNPAIPTETRPSTGSYGIMHDKIIIIDANSSNPNDPIVMSGSADWYSQMYYQDYNNFIFIQDSALAQAYTAEFNMMWGGSADTPNLSAALFGSAKTDLGLHTFYIAGHLVELYFSPSDNVDSHIGSTLLTANKDLYVGVFCFTRTGDAHDIITDNTDHVYTLATVDQYTPYVSTTVNGILGGLDTNYIIFYGDSTDSSIIYHNKLMIIDPSDTCSDPIVETGSYNWTTSANSDNDENVLIIHNDTLANIYLQSYAADFKTISGGRAPLHITSKCYNTETSALSSVAATVMVYPNPATQEVNISYTLPAAATCAIDVYNTVGQKVAAIADGGVQAQGMHNYSCTITTPGVYFVVFSLGNERLERKLVVTGY
jgi:PLD-like domain/Secretion system C-terminal sorting domain